MASEQAYSLRIAGIGGQGVVSVSSVIAHAAVKQGLSVSVIDRPRSAMRLGPITCDLRFGAPGVAPFIPAGSADAVLALEPLDGAMNAARLLKKSGTVLVNTAETRAIGELVSGERDGRREEWIALVEARGANVVRVNASVLAQKATGGVVNANYFLLGVLCKTAQGFPVLPQNIRGELAGGALIAFEAGLACRA